MDSKEKTKNKQEKEKEIHSKKTKMTREFGRNLFLIGPNLGYFLFLLFLFLLTRERKKERRIIFIGRVGFGVWRAFSFTFSFVFSFIWRRFLGKKGIKRI
jgi:hypothetical protein